MRYRVAIIGAALLAAVPTTAAVPPGSLASLYVRARAAEIAGDSRTANAGFAALLAQDPANPMIAARAYRQAISAGDMPLAIKAATMLQAKGILPPDGAILLALEQVRARDWVKARAATELLAKDRVFAFLAPYFRAWIAQASGAGDPLALVDSARTIPMAAAYQAEQRAFLLIAMGRASEAQAPSSMKLPDRVNGPDEGLALLLAHGAADFARQRLTPLALVMARLSTYSAPRLTPAWLLTAELLRAMNRPDLALAALGHTDRSDALAANAQAMRIGLLNDSGRKDAALVEALAAAQGVDAGADDWARVGDLYMAMDRPRDAAGAYSEAVKAADAAKLSTEMLWPLLLQQANALDQAGDWPRAKLALDRAYALAPTQAVVLNQVGYSRIDHGEDIARAGAMIEQASKLQPDDPAITDSLGWVTFLKGDPGAAVPLLERAAAKSPAEATINEHLGDAYWAVGRQYEARFAWRAALIAASDKDKARIGAKIDTGPTAKP